MTLAVRLLGLDPGLRSTGWGIVSIAGTRLSHVANGHISPPVGGAIAGRLVAIYDAIIDVIERHRPSEAAIEETFVNVNAKTTLKLGLARGVALLAPARAGLAVAEYSAKTVKKSVVGVGGADKAQVQAMVRRLLPGASIEGPDSADALAVAICHAHHVQTASRWVRPAAEAAALARGC